MKRLLIPLAALLLAAAPAVHAADEKQPFFFKSGDRGVVMFNAPHRLADAAAERKQKELQKRMDQINERQAKIYKLAQPKKHHFELKAVQ